MSARKLGRRIASLVFVLFAAIGGVAAASADKNTTAEGQTDAVEVSTQIIDWE